MLISNSFNVPLAPENAWKTLIDIPSIASCLPGTELTEQVDENTYKGKVSVRLGPVALNFSGTATFEERDELAHTAKVTAQGSDSKGRGGANAVVAFRIEPTLTGSRVDIATNVDLSGSIVQYGRGAGMIQNVANQLISQFAKSLEKQINARQQMAPLSAETTVLETTNQAQSLAHSGTKPISGFSLLFGAFWSGIKGLFRR